MAEDLFPQGIKRGALDQSLTSHLEIKNGRRVDARNAVMWKVSFWSISIRWKLPLHLAFSLYLAVLLAYASDDDAIFE